MLPATTFCVGFEQYFIAGIISITFTDPLIVIKSSDLAIKKMQEIPYFHTSTPKRSTVFFIMNIGTLLWFVTVLYAIVTVK